MSTQSNFIKDSYWAVGAQAVSLAEQKFGDGTGQLKLREVYDKFITKFPFVSKIISFQTFSNLVDEVLVDMKEMLEKNDSINNIISNSKGQ